MPNPKKYVAADFTAEDALTLVIGPDEHGVTTAYEVAQFATGFALNEIPSAVCLLAVGRDIRSGNRAAANSSQTPSSMVPAVVTAHPRGEATTTAAWPNAEAVFIGHVNGFSYSKINGKIQVTAHLIHWLAALGFSSCLTKTGSVAGVAVLNATAVLDAFVDVTGPGMYISELRGAQLISGVIANDLWGALKRVFCALANIQGMPVGPAGSCGGDGDITVNTFALNALNRMEGPSCAAVAASTDTSETDGEAGRAVGNQPAAENDYTYGVPLPLLSGQAAQASLAVLLGTAVSDKLGKQLVISYAAASFWDKLVGEICPLFQMAVVPMVQSALVIADTPAYRGGTWKTLQTSTVDAFDQSAELARPLRAVGVISTTAAETMAWVVGGAPAQGGTFLSGGCYVEDSVKPGDGLILYVESPPWLAWLSESYGFTGANLGLTNQQAIPTATTPSEVVPAGPPSPDSLAPAATALYEAYAHSVYVQQALRGRTGTVAGKLRFDIAPGSIVEVIQSTEKFDPGDDSLSPTLVGCVQRVTISINAESGAAGTTFQLSHIRTLAENLDDRTSVASHPLFGNAIHGNGKHGAPLIPAYDLAE